jgi:hypothetical protein
VVFWHKIGFPKAWLRFAKDALAFRAKKNNETGEPETSFIVYLKPGKNILKEIMY